MMPDLKKSQLSGLQMTPFAIPPEDILAGAPAPRFAVISKHLRGTVVTGIFQISPGIFSYKQVGDECSTVLRGRVIVTSDDGSRIECGPGDVLHIRDGSHTIFEALEEYEDYFVLTSENGINF